MSKPPRDFLQHVLDSIALIRTYTDGLTLEQFMSSPQVQDAVIRRIEVIGEAVKNLDPAWRATYPAIPWRQVAAMRDVLIHGYFRVDLAMTWKTVQDDLSPLAEEISKILATLPES